VVLAFSLASSGFIPEEHEHNDKIAQKIITNVFFIYPFYVVNEVLLSIKITWAIIIFPIYGPNKGHQICL
jgi:hypothetical protein